MPRIRTIKPDFFTHPKIVALSIPARLLFVSLLTQADDDGRLRDQPGLIRALAFGDEDSVKIHGLLTELCMSGRLLRYTVGAERFLEIKNFAEHQVINRRTASKLPPPNAIGALTEDSRSAHGGLTEDSHREGKGKEGNGTGKAADAASEEFAQFYAAYPRKVKREDAWRAWRLKRPPLAACLTTLAWQVVSRDWTKDDGKFIPYPATWIHAGQWNDEPPVPPATGLHGGDPWFEAQLAARGSKP